MVVAVAYPVIAESINSAAKTTNPFYCAPLIPCTKQPPGTIVCVSSCTVVLQDVTFVPGTINATQGATITWHNLDGVEHSVTALNSSLMNSPMIPPGGSFSYTIPKSVAPGMYYYFCIVHPFMIGLLNVIPANSTS
jgi:plastocyanin